MNAYGIARRHWAKLLAAVTASALAAVIVREIPATIRYIKMERM